MLHLADRTALRLAYRMDEDTCIAARLDEARLDRDSMARAQGLARRLVTGLRSRPPSGLDAFMHTFDLRSDEGIALMCLAEALLRVPDAQTADDLIRDKLTAPHWDEKLGGSSSIFVNATTFALLLTGRVLDQSRDEATGWRAALNRAVGRLGEPVVREAVGQAVKILGRQFVHGRTIDEALHRAEGERREGLTHSFDMLGEAARTHHDAARYLQSYQHALARIAKEAEGGPALAPGISVKLSALHPRYEALQAARTTPEVLSPLRDLVRHAAKADISLTIDAEEADRLELSMDIIEAILADDGLFEKGWEGFGLALQAYQKRALPLVDWIIALCRQYKRRIMVRLVKGAYWDAEIKATQVGGYSDYPVFTRKCATDVSYLACARRLLAASDVIYPAFATHNAYTIAAIKTLAGSARRFEFQRLHGMGEPLYQELAHIEASEGQARTPVRVYAPVGSHKELLAYLVRRLLENGANSSFVNRIANHDVSVDALIQDPVTELGVLTPYRNPAIPLPAFLYGAERRNSRGIDLSDPLVRIPLLARLEEKTKAYGAAIPDHETGQSLDERLALAKQAQIAWCEIGASRRAECLDATADLFERHADDILALLVHEAA